MKQSGLSAALDPCLAQHGGLIWRSSCTTSMATQKWSTLFPGHLRQQQSAIELVKVLLIIGGQTTSGRPLGNSCMTSLSVLPMCPKTSLSVGLYTCPNRWETPWKRVLPHGHPAELHACVRPSIWARERTGLQKILQELRGLSSKGTTMYCWTSGLSISLPAAGITFQAACS